MSTRKFSTGAEGTLSIRSERTQEGGGPERTLETRVGGRDPNGRAPEGKEEGVGGGEGETCEEGV